MAKAPESQEPLGPKHLATVGDFLLLRGCVLNVMCKVLKVTEKGRTQYFPEDPVIQSFLEADIFLKVSDKYLLSMVVEYFGRVGLPGHLYNRIHFFLAL
ncbi:hypothetical protein CB1_000688013 [Camelus ferus]|nr:hypothetical protein CB1_000688013 [Camelus ferus]